ncbi:uncharacterized protein LOC117815535 [Notolabrus celidotus]|uniref:uncharacterized protein LOC117815535 n=1 Tax=Notolabrus celidotus TaxID=1203425 RepID=UPI00148F4B81|nr:uncharacterized protein LOC117815535 [Notolabrus celidotus]
MGTEKKRRKRCILISGESQQTPVQNPNDTLTSTTQATASKTNSTCPPTVIPSTYIPATCPTPPRSLGLLSVNWTSECEGEVVLHLLPLNHSYHVCYNDHSVYKTLLSSWCAGPLSLGGSGKKQKGFDITELRKKEDCESLTLQCKTRTDVQAQLQAYKVVTALLCCVLIVLFLIRFTRPTVKALQSRLSDRRQNRWIGPTQSHSVSYHRGKGTVQDPDREKRLSYPALERLTVSDSREPSSNRNSGYNY